MLYDISKLFPTYFFVKIGIECILVGISVLETLYTRALRIRRNKAYTREISYTPFG